MEVFIGLVVIAVVISIIFNRDMKSNTSNRSENDVFVFQSKKQTINPTQFGYLAIRWSFDASKSSVELLKKSKYSTNGLISKVVSRPFATELQYIALYFAAYLTYATKFCQIPESVIGEIRKGSDDGINALREPDGSLYADDLKKILMYSIKKYIEAHYKDLEADPEIFNIDSSNAAKVFVELLSQTYEHTPEQSECVENLMTLNLGVTNGVNSIYDAMKQAGLVYRAN